MYRPHALVGVVDVAAIDAALARWEAEGAVHPIRTVPLDLVAAAVDHEQTQSGADLDRALAAVCRRYDGPRITHGDVT